MPGKQDKSKSVLTAQDTREIQNVSSTLQLEGAVIVQDTSRPPTDLISLAAKESTKTAVNESVETVAPRATDDSSTTSAAESTAQNSAQAKKEKQAKKTNRRERTKKAAKKTGQNFGKKALAGKAMDHFDPTGQYEGVDGAALSGADQIKKGFDTAKKAPTAQTASKIRAVGIATAAPIAVHSYYGGKVSKSFEAQLEKSAPALTKDARKLIAKTLAAGTTGFTGTVLGECSKEAMGLLSKSAASGAVSSNVLSMALTNAARVSATGMVIILTIEAGKVLINTFDEDGKRVEAAMKATQDVAIECGAQIGQGVQGHTDMLESEERADASILIDVFADSIYDTSIRAGRGIEGHTDMLESDERADTTVLQDIIADGVKKAATKVKDTTTKAVESAGRGVSGHTDMLESDERADTGPILDAIDSAASTLASTSAKTIVQAGRGAEAELNPTRTPYSVETDPVVQILAAIGRSAEDQLNPPLTRSGSVSSIASLDLDDTAILDDYTDTEEDEREVELRKVAEARRMRSIRRPIQGLSYYARYLTVGQQAADDYYQQTIQRRVDLERAYRDRVESQGGTYNAQERMNPQPSTTTTSYSSGYDSDSRDDRPTFFSRGQDVTAYVGRGAEDTLSSDRGYPDAGSSAQIQDEIAETVTTVATETAASVTRSLEDDNYSICKLG